MNYKVGDIIRHKNLGLMVLMSACDDSECRTLAGLHGKALFKMTHFCSESETRYILHQSAIDQGKVGLATEDEIVSELTDLTYSSEVTPDLHLHVFHQQKRVAIESRFCDEWLFLDLKELQALLAKIQDVL
jgi:hypothetical protein